MISDPLWLKDFFDPDKVGGPLVDLHVHDAHFIRLLFGMPTAVTSQGRMRGDVVEYCVSQFQFADPSLVVTSASGVINQQGRSFTHGFEIHFEKATLYFDLAVLAGGKLQITPLTLLDSKGNAEQPKLPAGDPMLAAFDAEIKEVAHSLKSGQPSAAARRRTGPRRDRALPQADAGGEEREAGESLGRAGETPAPRGNRDQWSLLCGGKLRLLAGDVHPRFGEGRAGGELHRDRPAAVGVGLDEPVRDGRRPIGGPARSPLRIG